MMPGAVHSVIRTRRAGVRAASALLAVSALISAFTPARAADAWRARVTGRLLALYDAAARDRSAAQPNSSGTAGSTAGAPSFATVPSGSTSRAPFVPRIDASGRVQIDVHYDCASAAPRAALASAGLSIETSIDLPPYCVVEGWAAPGALADIAQVAGVRSVTIPSYALPPHAPGRTFGPSPSSGPNESKSAPHGAKRTPRARIQSAIGTAIDANGIAIMRADEFVSQTGIRGAGVTVGIQSTGVASLAVIQQRGELPSVQVFMPAGESIPNLADEGTALLEEVHAVAPDAGLAFCGPNTFVEYTSCLQQLIGAGATVLVDDVIFLSSDPMSLSNAESQAVESLLERNPSVALFTVVGNYNGSYWEGAYTPVALASQGLPTLSCPTANGTQTDAYVAEFGSSASEQLTVTGDGTFPVFFAWADPSGANVSQFDVYWSNNADSTQSGCFSTAGVNGNNITPSMSLTAGTYTLYVATPDASSAGKFLKLWMGGDGLTFLSTATPGGIISAQAYASKAITIGAVNGSDGIGNQIETFSSVGPLSLAFPAPQTVQEPALVAPDGIAVDAAGTYFAADLFPDGNFYGTSASVPNAGAVAALLRAAFPQLTVPQLLQTLTAGAVQLGVSLPDAAFGYGRIDAMGALATLPAPTITALPDSTVDAGASTPPLSFSVSGTGSLHFVVTSSNTSLVPATLAAPGAPGVSIQPSGCGTSVSSCTAMITAAAGAGGTTNLTLEAADGANRFAPAVMKITVNGPPPSGTSSTSGTSSASAADTAAPSGGGAFGWLELDILGMLAAWRAACRALRPRCSSVALKRPLRLKSPVARD